MHVVTRVEVEREILVGKLYDGSYADGYLITVEVEVSGEVIDCGDGDPAVTLDKGLDIDGRSEERAAIEALWDAYVALESSLPFADVEMVAQ